jgi:hypothetical protein
MGEDMYKVLVERLNIIEWGPDLRGLHAIGEEEYLQALGEPIVVAGGRPPGGSVANGNGQLSSPVL